MWRETQQFKTLVEQLEESAMDVMGPSNTEGVDEVNTWLSGVSHENTGW